MELVVLLDDSGHAVGTHDKATVHHDRTPLHLAFSSYVVNRDREVLVTQRAHDKRTWPGIWTNTCCGHPAPGERLDSAVLRRLSYELGMTAERADPVLPRFRYRAVMDNGVVENEICPVFLVVHDDRSVTPRADEVADHRWQPWSEFAQQVLDGTSDLSPWCQDQVRQLHAMGSDPLAWPTSDADSLPPAAVVA
ncbi:MAG: isopentenyl-diphosphate Delta-isomerase [Rhodococcus sp. (in: high G+C Gram-positive bacteria)]